VVILLEAGGAHHTRVPARGGRAPAQLNAAMAEQRSDAMAATTSPTRPRGARATAAAISSCRPCARSLAAALRVHLHGGRGFRQSPVHQHEEIIQALGETIATPLRTSSRTTPRLVAGILERLKGRWHPPLARRISGRGSSCAHLAACRGAPIGAVRRRAGGRVHRGAHRGHPRSAPLLRGDRRRRAQHRAHGPPARHLRAVLPLPPRRRSATPLVRRRQCRRRWLRSCPSP
jgi:hypothetical protein